MEDGGNVLQAGQSCGWAGEESVVSVLCYVHCRGEVWCDDHANGVVLVVRRLY